MSSVLRLLGAGFILLCAVMVSREYSRYLDRRLENLKAEATTDLEAEIDRIEKNKRVAKALLIGAALAIGVMAV